MDSHNRSANNNNVYYFLSEATFQPNENRVITHKGNRMYYGSREIFTREALSAILAFVYENGIQHLLKYDTIDPIIQCAIASDLPFPDKLRHLYFSKKFPFYTFAGDRLELGNDEIVCSSGCYFYKGQEVLKPDDFKTFTIEADTFGLGLRDFSSSYDLVQTIKVLRQQPRPPLPAPPTLEESRREKEEQSKLQKIWEAQIKAERIRAEQERQEKIKAQQLKTEKKIQKIIRSQQSKAQQQRQAEQKEEDRQKEVILQSYIIRQSKESEELQILQQEQISLTRELDDRSEVISAKQKKLSQLQEEMRKLTKEVEYDLARADKTAKELQVVNVKISQKRQTIHHIDSVVRQQQIPEPMQATKRPKHHAPTNTSFNPQPNMTSGQQQEVISAQPPSMQSPVPQVTFREGAVFKSVPFSTSTGMARFETSYCAINPVLFQPNNSTPSMTASTSKQNVSTTSLEPRDVSQVSIETTSTSKPSNSEEEQFPLTAEGLEEFGKNLTELPEDFIAALNNSPFGIWQNANGESLLDPNLNFDSGYSNDGPQ